MEDVIFMHLSKDTAFPPVVNFINILRTNFLYERRFGSFFYLHVTWENDVHMKNSRVKCWWNWHLISHSDLSDDTSILLRADPRHRGQAHCDRALRAVLDRPKVLSGKK